MKRIKIAQIGTMHDHAKPTFNSLLKNDDIFEVVGIAEICSGREKRLYDDAPHLTLEELLRMDDLEAVAIETEEEKATEIAQLFADKGIAVHLDKPGSPDIAAFNRLVDTLKEKNAVLQMGYMYRYNPALQDIFTAVKNGELGEIYSVEAQMSVHHDPDKHIWLQNYPDGMMYFLGCHMVDLVYRLMGEPLEVIRLNARTGQDNPDTVDFGFCVFRYENGSSFVKSCSAEINGFDRRQLIICGTKGTVEVNPLERFYHHADGSYLQHTLYRMTTCDTEKDPWNNNGPFIDTGSFDRYDTMMREFGAYIRGKENPYGYEFEKKLFRLVMECVGVTE